MQSPTDAEANMVRDEVRAATRGLDMAIQRLVHALEWADSFTRGRPQGVSLTRMQTPADEPVTRFLE